MRNKNTVRATIALLIFASSSCHPDPVEKIGCTIFHATNYDPSATIADNCNCKFDGLVPACDIQNPTKMNIPTVIQQTAVWCWLAVGEMIFRYYGLPVVNGAGDYQCGIVGAVGYAQGGACNLCNVNCGNCVRPAGSPQMISYMLSEYPKIACRNIFQTKKTLNHSFVNGFLPSNVLLTELNNKRPVIAGINPGAQFILPGNSMHVALIVGFHYVQGSLILHVNDPFPYASQGTDPYKINAALTNGNLYYEIPYNNFVFGLKWNTSWMNIGW